MRGQKYPNNNTKCGQRARNEEEECHHFDDPIGLQNVYVTYSDRPESTYSSPDWPP